jgi:hypothetical protein
LNGSSSTSTLYPSLACFDLRGRKRGTIGKDNTEWHIWCSTMAAAKQTRA